MQRTTVWGPRSGIIYSTFQGFSHPKSSHFWTPFLSFFRPHFGTPFGRAFWPTLAPKGADLASPCRFWNLFGTPLGSKMGPWSDQVRPEMAKKTSPPSRCRRPETILEMTCVPKGSQEPFLSTLGPPCVTKGPFWNPLNDQGAHSGPPWVP